VIVPGGEHRAASQDCLIARLCREFGIFRPHEVHVFGVGVDVVSDKQEKVGLCCDQRFPDGLIEVLVRAGTKRDAAEQAWIRHLRRSFSDRNKQGENEQEHRQERSDHPFATKREGSSFQPEVRLLLGQRSTRRKYVGGSPVTSTAASY
jgi:hypothetical protein